MSVFFFFFLINSTDLNYMVLVTQPQGSGILLHSQRSVILISIRGCAAAV